MSKGWNTKGEVLKNQDTLRYGWKRLNSCTWVKMIIAKEMATIWQAHSKVSKKTLENLEFIEIEGRTQRWEMAVDGSLKKRNRSLDCSCNQWEPRQICMRVYYWNNDQKLCSWMNRLRLPWAETSWRYDAYEEIEIIRTHFDEKRKETNKDVKDVKIISLKFVEVFILF